MFFSIITLLACGPKEPLQTVEPTIAPSRIHTQKPTTLEKEPFSLPSLAKGTLSNNIPIALSKNDEVPLVYLWITFDAGSWTDPDTQIGLAKAAMDMLDEGAGELSAGDLSKELKKLASSISTEATMDGASIRLQCLKKNIQPSLAILSLILKQPTFPSTVWDRKSKAYLQERTHKISDPKQIGKRVWRTLLYGDQYAGRLQKESHIHNLNPEDIQKWYETYITPQNAQIWIGGNTTINEIQPFLEEEIGTWTTENPIPLPKKPTAINLKEPERTFIYLVDKPGSSQSIVYLGHGVGTRNDEHADRLLLANQAFGGMFTARVNMNLREDKGWTYGAWTWLSYSYYPGTWTMHSSVITKHTAAAIREVIKDIRESKQTRTITAEEFERGRGDLLGQFPLKFEKPSYLLNRQIEISRYNLPKDWLNQYQERLSKISLGDSQASWNDIIDPEAMFIVVVGDRSVVETDLLGLGYTVIHTDHNGQTVNP